MNKALETFDVRDKQSLIDCLFQCQDGRISCRRMADEIQQQIDALLADRVGKDNEQGEDGTA